MKVNMKRSESILHSASAATAKRLQPKRNVNPKSWRFSSNSQLSNLGDVYYCMLVQQQIDVKSLSGFGESLKATR